MKGSKSDEWSGNDKVWIWDSAARPREPYFVFQNVVLGLSASESGSLEEFLMQILLLNQMHILPQSLSDL